MQIGAKSAGGRAAAPSPVVPQSRAAAAPSANATFGVDRLESATPDTSGLTAEEIQLQQAGLLPADFATLRQLQREQGKDAAIAHARQGLKGPFSRRFGDPDVMLAGARRIQKNPELAKLAQQVQPGDIIVKTYNKPDDVISVATKGPFVHALVCVQAGPPAQFIEALGVSGDIKDPTGNKVLRSMLAETAGDGESYRLMRPTANLAPREAEKAIARAIAYCEAQLGKPYDFAFTDTNGRGMNDAFYCSELAYKAYADPKGADLPIAISKSSERDVALGAVSQILDGLKPDDKGGLTFNIAQLAATKPLPDAKLVDFIVNQVAPGTAATRRLADSPERRAALRSAVERALKGQAFKGIEGALDRFSRDDAAGRFKGELGFVRKVAAGAKVGFAGLSDVRALTKGVGFWRSLGASWTLVKTLVPHSETLAKFFWGADDGRTVAARKTLDQLDGLARDMHRIPLLGRLWPLPSRPRVEVNRDFVSPTDLAWADVTHWDYNVRADFPLDQVAVEARGPFAKKLA